MTGDNFEYAIKKDVRNNPIVRELDRARYREMWRTAVVCAFVLMVLLFSVWRRSVLISHGFKLVEVRDAIAKTEEQNRLWRLEIETLRSPARIERDARRLGMIEPGPADRVVIERVVSSPPPAGSVVARR